MLHATEPNARTDILLLDYWKPIEGFESVYEVSVTGRVRRVRDGRFLKPSANYKGYRRVVLHWRGVPTFIFIHRLVLSTFGKALLEGQQTNHRDGWKANNRFSNLQPVTCAENIQHACDTGLRKRRLSREQILAILALKGQRSTGDTAAEFGVSVWTVKAINAGRFKPLRRIMERQGQP